MSVKAAVLQEPGRFTLEEFPEPKIDQHSMMLRINQVGVCGSDRHMFLGHSNLQFPILPGHEMLATVAERGPAIEERMAIVGGEIREGDQVTVVPSSRNCGKCWYCLHVPHKPALCMDRTVYGFRTCAEEPHLFGAYAEYMFIDPHSWVFKIPEELSQERAVLVEPTAVASRAVERALGVGVPHIGEGYGIGKRVLVAGTGPIGILVVAVLRGTGAGQIIVTDAMESRLEMAKELGADVALNIAETTLEERQEAVKELTDGVGVDIAIEAAGVPAAFSECLDHVRRGGRVVEVGHYTDPGDTSIHPHQVCNKELDILGCWSYPPMQFKTGIDFLLRATVPVEKLVTHHMGIAQLQQAVEMLVEPGVMKVVIEPGG